MKKCPTCDKTFEDSMRFCQIDGSPLVEDVAGFDPYATIVGKVIPVEPALEPDPAIHYTVGSVPIAEPDDVLDLPANDPLQTMYVSESEMQAVFEKEDPAADIIEIPPIEVVSHPEPPSFIAPESPALDFGTPPPSPFSMDVVHEEPAAPIVEEAFSPISPEPEASVYETPFQAPPVYEEPVATPFDEAATMIQPSFTSPFDPPPAPVAEWTPPPAPEVSWQNQEIGSTTPFQPPPVGAVQQNKTLAIVSLVCGILSLLCCSSLFLVGLAAIVTGFMARGKAAKSPTEFGGGGLALAGVILGGLSLVLGGLYWILVLSGTLSIPNF